MKKKSILYSDLSKKELENLKELYIQKKVESMSHQELKKYVLEIISHQINDTIGKEEEMEAWREISDFFGEQFEKIKSFENISIEGIYSHLSSADEDNALDPKSITQLQRLRFNALLKQINLERNHQTKIHLANSAGMLLNKDFHFHMVRVGLSMYGYSPLTKIDKNLSLEPALFLKVKVAFIRTIEPGVGVSYGGKFVSYRKTKLAVLSIGYADGVPRNLSGKINVIHNNKFYPQVGSITMDQMMIDITDSHEIKVGTTMVLLGSDGDKTISPLDWARESNTIPWEILCSFKNRLPKVQVD